MEKKNTLVITILAIVVLLVLVLTATFAYFAAKVEGVGINGNNVVVNAQMPSSDTFFGVESSGNIEITVTSADMLVKAANDTDAVESGNKNLTLTLKGGTASSTITCKYDLIFEWVSEKKYTEASSTLTAGQKEFTLQIESSGSGDYCSTADEYCTLPTVAETNIASGGAVVGLIQDSSKTKVTLVSGAKISSKGGDNGSKVEIKATAKVYNAQGVDQSTILKDNTYVGKVYVDNVEC